MVSINILNDRICCLTLILIDGFMSNFTNWFILGNLVVVWNCFTVVIVLILTGPESGLHIVLVYVLKGLKSMHLLIDV